MLVAAVPRPSEAGVGKLLTGAGHLIRQGVTKLTSKGAGKAAAKIAPKAGRVVVTKAAAKSATSAATKATGAMVLLTGSQAVTKAATTASGQVLDNLGVAGAKVLPKLSASGASKLADLSADLARSPHRGRWLELLGKFGDTAADFLWKNKGSVFVGATATAVVLQPDDFLKATGRLVETAVTTAGSQIGKPLLTGTLQHVAGPVVNHAAAAFPWKTTFFALLTIVSGMGAWYWKQWRMPL
ncbi:MAG: hypothetical protein R3C19_27105 [Planctomycetaceae bacterium]